jgi:hypothetical protein
VESKDPSPESGAVLAKVIAAQSKDLSPEVQAELAKWEAKGWTVGLPSPLPGIRNLPPEGGDTPQSPGWRLNMTSPKGTTVQGRGHTPDAAAHDAMRQAAGADL